MAVVVKLN